MICSVRADHLQVQFIVLSCLQRPLHALLQAVPALRSKYFFLILEGRHGQFGIVPGQAIKFRGPGNGVRSYVPLPATNLCQALSFIQRLVFLPQCLLRVLTLLRHRRQGHEWRGREKQKQLQRQYIHGLPRFSEWASAVHSAPNRHEGNRNHRSADPCRSEPQSGPQQQRHQRIEQGWRAASPWGVERKCSQKNQANN